MSAVSLDNSTKYTTTDGPDQIRPSDNYYSTEANGAVKLRDNVQLNDTMSFPTMLKRAAENYPNHPAIRYYPDKTTLVTVTYLEYLDIVRTVAKAFLKLGLERYHGVCIIGYNSPEWFYSGLAATFAGGIQAGIYTTNSAEACLHCITLATANIVVVENDVQLQKILQIRDRAPHIKAIVQYSGKPTSPGVYSWSDIMEIGKNEDDIGLENVLRTISINECCVLVYTSGTTSLPKAVMLHHDNIFVSSRIISKHLRLKEGHDRTISYLPLSHVVAQMFDFYLPIYSAATIYIADKNALKNTLMQNIIAVRPTILAGVPRVWEKLKEHLEADEKRYNRVFQYLLSNAKVSALAYYRNLANGRRKHESASYKLSKLLVFNKIKKQNGLECVKIYGCGGAPILFDTKEYFCSLDMPIFSGYGLSETGSIGIMGTPEISLVDGIGFAIDNVKVKIHNPDENGSGEICLYGRNILMGYLNDPEKTAEAFDNDHWFHSGDIGVVENSIYKITGRIKELIITAGGENIPFPLIEGNIKAELPIVSNVVLIGDKRKYLSVLLTLKCKLDPNNLLPTDDLTDDVKQWCRIVGYECSRVSDIVDNKPKKVYDSIQDAIRRANEKSISNAQKVQKFTILPRDFSIGTGEIAPTMKLKRCFVVNLYSDLIEDMYKNC